MDKNLLILSAIILILIVNIGIIIYGLIKKKKENYEDNLKDKIKSLMPTLPQDIQDFLNETNLYKKDQMIINLSKKYDIKTLMKIFGNFFLGGSILNELIKKT